MNSILEDDKDIYQSFNVPQHENAIYMNNKESKEDTNPKKIEELNNRMETMSKGVTMLERDNVSLRGCRR